MEFEVTIKLNTTSGVKNLWSWERAHQLRQTDAWGQTRASKGAIVSVCCAVRPAHRRETLLEPSTHNVLTLEKKLRISDKGY
jgi:hypothetical protein